ncbi:hypothetical protein ACA910_019663 [Epithemia clementina (nom. ined.)]
MGKQGKRQRKFQSTGGVKGRLDKGTITKKGKIPKRKRAESQHNKKGSKTPRHSESDNREQGLEDNEKYADDFAAETPKSLAGLDIDEFFAQASEMIDEEEEASDDSEDDQDDANVHGDHSKPNNQKRNSGINSNEEKGKGTQKVAVQENKVSSKHQKDSKKQSKVEGEVARGEKGNTQASRGLSTTKQQKSKHSDSKDDSGSGDNSGSEDDSDSDGDSKDGSDKEEDSDDSDKSKSDSDEDDSDSDDDLEVAEKRLKKQMAKLNKSDPEFHEFLQENENALLQFGQGEEDDDDMDIGGEDDGSDEEKAKRGSPATVQLTLGELKKLEVSVFESHSIKSLKKLVTAYRCACHLADTSEDKGSRAGESGIKYMIDSSKVYDALMVTCLNRFHEIFSYHLFHAKTNHTKKSKAEVEEGDDDDEDEDDEKKKNSEKKQVVDDEKPILPNKMENSERWKDMSRIMRSFFSSTLHLMSEAKEPELLKFVLQRLSKHMRFLSAFPRVAESMIRNLVDKWSAPLDSSEDYQAVRLQAFFRIRQLAITQPFPFIETCLRKVYLAYARRAKHGSSSSPTVEILLTLTFMGNSVVELYSLDLHSSYQHAFVYIRQLALHLRSAIQKTSSDATQQLFRWQYMHCLKLWVSVLSGVVVQEDGAQMRSLIYPLTEIIYGVARLAPSNVRHLPFRLHCVRLLQQLAASSEMYIPTTSLLLDCLDWKEWYMKPKKTSKRNTTAGLNLLYLLKLPKEDSLRTHEQQEAAIVAIFVLLEREVDLYAYSAGFPEFSIWIRRRMKAFSRATRQPRWRRFAGGIIELCEKHASNAIASRAKLHEAPKDVHQLECLRPSSVPSMIERHKAAIDKEAKLLAAASPLMSKNSEHKAADDEDEDIDDKEEEAAVKMAGKEQKNSKRKRKPDKRDKSSSTTKYHKEDPNVLTQEDDVHEGVDWSDDDD